MILAKVYALKIDKIPLGHYWLTKSAKSRLFALAEKYTS
jgi:hypothetical protein